MHFIALVFLLIHFVFVLNQQIFVDYGVSIAKLSSFWKNTGFCPPDPKENLPEYFARNDVLTNIKLIGALPYRGIENVRIHWLINLIRVVENREVDTKYLDDLIDYLIKNNLKPQFEWMGWPTTYNDKGQVISPNVSLYKNYNFWYSLSTDIVSRYIEKYGISSVKSWRFESWNEPDLKNYNKLNFVLTEYLEYVNALADGLNAVFKSKLSDNSSDINFGGPGGLFRTQDHHKLCWGLLKYCDKIGLKNCPIKYLSFHRKGDGRAQVLINDSLVLIGEIHEEFPNLKGLPVANDESDMIKNWSANEEFRADVRYAAMIVKVVCDFYKKFTLNKNITVEEISNDNGFLNYHPYYFTQRTLFTRFQMNLTQPPHNQFIKKPCYSVMALLSLLAGENTHYVKENSTLNNALFSIITGKNVDEKQNTSSLIIAYSNGRDVDNINKIPVRVNMAGIDSNSRYVIYGMDNIRTNPFAIWKDGGSPPFPQKYLRNLMRQHEEPYRLDNPKEVEASTLTIDLNLMLPSIFIVHVCSKNLFLPGRVTNLRISNVTKSEVLLTWNDENIKTRCVKTYEIEFKSSCYSNGYTKIHAKDTIFLSYHYAPNLDDNVTCEATLGSYRVRVMDYWHQTGPYSKVVSFP